MRVKFRKIKNPVETRAYVQNVLAHLGISGMNKTIRIKFVSKLDNGKSHGECSGDKSVAYIKIATNFNREIQLRTLAHELCHVSQFFKGHLDSELTTWKGHDFSNAAYDDQPWEIEAHAIEDFLYKASV